MRARFNRESLLSAVQVASAAVAARDVKPILRNLKLSVSSEYCRVSATDLDLGLTVKIAGYTCDEAGDAILPTSKTLAILRESTDEELSLEATVNHATFRGGFNEFEMPSEDPKNFPDVPGLDSTEPHHVVQADVLKTLIHRTLFAAAKENPRYAVTGSLWEMEGDKIRLVATDGRRMACMDGKATAQHDHKTTDRHCVVPTKAMAILERSLCGDVLVAFGNSQVTCSTGTIELYSRLVDGRYPAYRDVFPKKVGATVPFKVGPLLGAIRQAAVMTDEESKKVIFAFADEAIAGGKLTLTASGASVGRSKVELAVEYTGKKLSINFDPRFVLDMLRTLDPATELTLGMQDGSSPAVFRVGVDYSYVVMPLS